MRTLMILLSACLASVSLAQYPNNMTEIDALGNEFYFGIDSFNYPEGGGFAYEITVLNNSSNPFVWFFNSSQTFDQWLVSEETGDTLWMWSWGYGFIGIMIDLTIDPGESFSKNGEAEFGVLSYTAPPGDYLLHGNWVPYDWTLTPLVVTLPVQIQSSGTEIRENISANEFKLFPAYPNPFNPTTIISFELATAGFVELKVFDIAGREVGAFSQTPLQRWYPAGMHEVIWDAEGMGSGVYFVRLEAGDFEQTRKMLLVK